MSLRDERTKECDDNDVQCNPRKTRGGGGYCGDMVLQAGVARIVLEKDRDVVRKLKNG